MAFGVKQADIAAIKEKTDNFPDDPADESAIEAAINAAHTVTDEAVAAVDSAVGVVDGVVDDVKTQTDKVPSLQQEIEWVSSPVSQQVASGDSTNLTAGSITPTFPTGATRVRAILVASIHAANQAANTHNISLKVQGQKAGGGYGDLLDLTAQTTLALADTAGVTDGWVGAVDVTTLVNASAAQYDFRFVVDSDDAGAVNYTTSFALVLVYSL
jgi:hypothetical protein